MVRSVSAAPGAPSCRERAGSRAERPIVDRGVAPPSRQVMVFEPDADGLVRRPDQLAVEEPLQVRLRTPAGTSTLAVTMRTPGSDMELVAGLLLAEGIVDGPDDLAGLTTCLGDEASGGQRYNVVTAALRGPPRQLGRERTLVTSSACGVCGTTSVDAVVGAGWPTLPTGPVMPLAWVVALPELLRAQQRSFDVTGAVHGAGLARAGGSLLVVREDVGRHNAVDKVVGWAMLRRLLPLAEAVLVVSGRVSFEIVQKALRGGVPVVVAVSGATSLAVELAERSGMTLVGFARGDRCTVYCGRQRLCG